MKTSNFQFYKRSDAKVLPTIIYIHVGLDHAKTLYIKNEGREGETES